ncbi:MAG: hypothetical protein WAV74_13305 [Anaerolineae bacterium]
MMWIVLGSFLAISLVLLGILFAWSPGQPQPFLDETGEPLAGSLSEKIHVEINGVEQGLFIKSRNIHTVHAHLSHQTLYSPTAAQSRPPPPPNEGLHGKLTLISAASGFGKTTLVSEWVSERMKDEG